MLAADSDAMGHVHGIEMEASGAADVVSVELLECAWVRGLGFCATHVRSRPACV